MLQLNNAISNSGQLWGKPRGILVVKRNKPETKKIKIKKILVVHPPEWAVGSCERWKEVRMGAWNRRRSKP